MKEQVLHTMREAGKPVSAGDVMQRGYTSMPMFSNFVRQAWGRSPSARRRGDIGKYAL